MKKNQERALNAFAALESLPDGMLLEAEQALIAVEGGVIAPVKKPKPKGGFARFMRSGWSVAAMPPPSPTSPPKCPPEDAPLK